MLKKWIRIFNQTKDLCVKRQYCINFNMIEIFTAFPIKNDQIVGIHGAQRSPVSQNPTKKMNFFCCFLTVKYFLNHKTKLMISGKEVFGNRSGRATGTYSCVLVTHF